MKRIGIFSWLLGVGLAFYSCKPADKKPDAVVMDNDQLRDSLAAKGGTSQANDLASAPIEPGEATAATDRYSTLEADTLSGNQVGANTGNAGTKTGAVNGGSKKVGKTRASAQRMLRQDARLARTMSLQRFGTHMSRKWTSYRGLGELSYDDGKVEIKITDEELKIETPEGKFKRERDEVKIKTDSKKVKKEIRS